MEVCSYLDCHTETHCHLQLFLGPSVFNLMLVHDLSEVPVYGLHLHTISPAGLARLFPTEHVLVFGKLRQRSARFPFQIGAVPCQVPACPSMSKVKSWLRGKQQAKE